MTVPKRKHMPKGWWKEFGLNCCGVYAIVNISTDECYVGSSINIENRIKQLYHGRANEKLKIAFDRYGIECFEFMIMQKMPKNTSKRKRFMAEAEWQMKLKPEYNIKTLDEGGGEPLTKDIKVKISIANTGKKRTAEERAARSEWMKGNERAKGKHWTLSKETKENMKWSEERREKYLCDHGAGSASRIKARQTVAKRNMENKT